MSDKNGKKIKKNRILFLPIYTPVCFFVLFLCDGGRIFAVTLAAALIHELGHVAAAKLFGAGVERIALYPFGAEIRLKPGLRSYIADAVISGAGAAANLVTYLAAVSEAIPLPEGMGSASVVLAAINLLPIKGLDGGDLLYSLICGFSEEKYAVRTLKLTSAVFLFSGWTVSVYILLALDGSPSLFFIVCSLFGSVFLRGGS